MDGLTSNAAEALDEIGLETPFAEGLDAEEQFSGPSPGEFGETPFANASEAEWFAATQSPYPGEFGATGGGEDEKSAARAAEPARPLLGGSLWAYGSRAGGARVAIFVPKAALGRESVEVMLYVHGLLNVCGGLKLRPAGLVSDARFQLGKLVDDTRRPMVLVVPLFQTGDDKTWSAHGLGRPEALNGLLAEVPTEIGKRLNASAPAISRLVIAGHSRAYDVLYPLARAHGSRAFSEGALAKLSNLWLLDATYGTFPAGDFDALVAARPGLAVDVVYLQKSPSTDKFGGRARTGPVALQPIPTVRHCDVPGHALPALFAGLDARSGPQPAQRQEQADVFESDDFATDAEESEALAWLDVEAQGEGEEEQADEADEADGVEAETEAEWLEAAAGESTWSFAEASEAGWSGEAGEIDSWAAEAIDELEAADGEWFDAAEAEEESEELERFGEFEDERDAEWESGELEEELEEEASLAASGLTPAERKAVEITSTFETGKRGGFYGLSGNFDGQGLSFGLVNWTIGTGSLQPLLRDFAAEQPARWASVFGPDAARFLQLVSPTGDAARKDQHRFAVEQMNIRTVQNGKAKWAIREPWVTYFKRLSEERPFQQIQIRYVRNLLARGEYFCGYFKLKSEAAFAFMFDAVSSHGKWWLTKKIGGKEKRRLLLEPQLKAFADRYGEGKVPESDILLAIANVLGATSAARWAQKVRDRKRWFVTGQHPRAKELQGLTPRLDAPYSASAGAPPAGASPVPVAPAPASTPAARSSGDHAAQIKAAIVQATTAGEAEDREALKKTLGKIDVAAWFGGLVPDATFLGLPILASGGKVPGVHGKLFDVLQGVERSLLAKYPGLSAGQLGKQFGLYRIVGLRPPKKATGGGKVSLHCFGLAIDINHKTNPFVGNHKPKEGYGHLSVNRSPCIIKRAMKLLLGEDFDVEAAMKTGPDRAAMAGKAWDIHHRASQTLAEYLRLADEIDGDRVKQLVAAARARGEAKSLDQWKQRIALDRKVIPHWDFQHHPRPQQGGYMDLPRELVVALVEHGLDWGGQFRTAKDIMHFGLELENRH